MELFESFPGFGTMLLIILPTAYLLGTPLLIYATFRTEAFPTIQPVEPHAEIPDLVRSHFYQAHESLTQLGFTNEGMYYLPQAVTNVQGFVAVFIDRVNQIGVISAVVIANANNISSIQEKFVEFGTRFVDDSEINTSNQRTLGAFPVREGFITTVHPRLQDIGQLHAAHLAMRNRYDRGRRPTLRMIDKFHGDIAAAISSNITEEFEFARTAGYLKYIGGDPENFSVAMSQSPYRPPGSIELPQYAPTLYGAYLMTWKQLWPIKPICTFLRRRRDNKLLQDTDFASIPQRTEVAKA